MANWGHIFILDILESSGETRGDGSTVADPVGGRALSRDGAGK
jgi:hypothetical protein